MSQQANPNKKSKHKEDKIMIGSLDCVDIPQFGLFDLPCKIDTGAQTSAIHCHKVRLSLVDGKETITFELLDPKHNSYNDREFRTTDFKERKVRSSSGHAAYRYVIMAEIILFDKTFKTEFTLADREQMKFPVLIGHQLLKDRFIVDVSQKNLSSKLKTSQPNKT